MSNNVKCHSGYRFVDFKPQGPSYCSQVYRISIKYQLHEICERLADEILGSLSSGLILSGLAKTHPGSIN